jgi:putative redox protein
MAETVTVSERPSGGIYANDARTSRHHFYVDEPAALGSSDIGPTPFEYLAAALGGCTTITLRMYIERKKWAVEHLAVDVDMHRAEGHNVFVRKLHLRGDLDEAQRNRLVEIANKCPVHKVLMHGSDVETQLA